MMGPLPITDPGHVRCDQSISDSNFNKNEHPSHYLSYHHLHSTDSLKAVTFIGMFPGLGSNEHGEPSGNLTDEPDEFEEQRVEVQVFREITHL